jgi:hypothetical protein
MARGTAVEYIHHTIYRLARPVAGHGNADLLHIAIKAKAARLRHLILQLIGQA